MDNHANKTYMKWPVFYMSELDITKMQLVSAHVQQERASMAIPMATMNATIQLFDKRFDLQGFRGHWRNWASYDWNSLVQSWYRVRAVASPYTWSSGSWHLLLTARHIHLGFLRRTGRRSLNLRINRLNLNLARPYSGCPTREESTAIKKITRPA
jgi:hypothetical protein